MSDALEMAVFFHETYERFAPSFGYATREDTKQFDPSSNNGRLMQAVCAEWLERHAARIRELEEEIDRLKAAYAALRDGREAHITKLEAQIAAHEKVCAGRWVSCSERLPEIVPYLSHGGVIGSSQETLVCLESGRIDTDRLHNYDEHLRPSERVPLAPSWMDWPDRLVTHWLDVKQPDEGVRE